MSPDSPSAPSPTPRPKPRLRGVSHALAFFLALPAGVLLVLAAPTTLARITAAVYGVSLAALFGVSALYHVPMWQPLPRARLRRLDHATIFLLIAGTYTPLCSLLLGPGRGHTLLAIVWIGALLGVAKSILWPHAPRGLLAVLYIALGWVGASSLPNLRGGMGDVGLAAFAVAGVLYSVGAIVYALRRPDPAPRTFGYHEIFHALVIAAAAMQYAVVLHVVRAAR